MPDHSLHAEGDPAARVEAARSEMIASATEAWEAIRAMEPSAERVDLERSFAEQARASLKLAPESVLLEEHAQVADRNTDPYHDPTLASLARLEQGQTEGVSLDEGLRATLAHVRDEIGERLTALFSIREDELRIAGTSVEEMVARFSLAERSEGQRASWIIMDPLFVHPKQARMEVLAHLQPKVAKRSVKCSAVGWLAIDQRPVEIP